MTKKKWIITFIIALVVIGLGAAFVGPVMSQVEQPKYKVMSASGDIEVRQYNSMMIAEVMVAGKRQTAINDGFRDLADFIFGNNKQGEANQKIAMTAPVQQQARDDVWVVSFVMPAEYTMENIPKPNNANVILKQVPAKKFVVITFSGRGTDKNISKHQVALLQYIKDNNLKVVGDAKYAFYNPPWTLPMLRRNEVMFELK